MVDNLGLYAKSNPGRTSLSSVGLHCKMHLTDSHDSSPRITSEAEVLHMSEWIPCAKSYPNLCPVQNQLTWNWECQGRQKERDMSLFFLCWDVTSIPSGVSKKTTVGIHEEDSFLPILQVLTFHKAGNAQGRAWISFSGGPWNPLL